MAVVHSPMAVPAEDDEISRVVITAGGSRDNVVRLDVFRAVTSSTGPAISVENPHLPFMWEIQLVSTMPFEVFVQKVEKVPLHSPRPTSNRAANLCQFKMASQRSAMP